MDGYRIGDAPPEGTCPICGKRFERRVWNQKYCSSKCQRRTQSAKWRRENGVESMDDQWPSVSFRCSQCGKMVVTEPGWKDRRSRFCSASCEKKFWRHPHWENPTTRTNFHSVKEYASWERRTNGE